MSLDYLIVGQGLAGTLLAHFLQQAGKHVGLIDAGHADAATRVAAGIINPVTGRRYVKAWRIDELLPAAEETYRELEKELGLTLYHPQRVLRTLFNRGEENDWLARSGETGYESYILDHAELGAYAEKTVPAFSYGEVDRAAQIDIGGLIEAYRERWLAAGRLKAEAFDYTALEVRDSSVRYRDWTAASVVFCEGHRAADNPFFNHLPFRGAKGEALLVRIPGGHFEKILKHRVFIVPLEDDLYWIGATYNWKFTDSQPTPAMRDYLEERLSDVLQVPFEVVEHRAAVRPTVRDRRPFLGQHPEHNPLFLFNGLGTKGASLGPFWARHMADYLLKKVKLDPAVDIRRFEGNG